MEPKRFTPDWDTSFRPIEDIEAEIKPERKWGHVPLDELVDEIEYRLSHENIALGEGDGLEP